MDQKVLLLLVILALVGIAYYVRFKPHRASSDGAGAGARTSQNAGPGAKPAKNDPCERKCTAEWNTCGAHCQVDLTCSNRCERARDSCLAACR